MKKIVIDAGHGGHDSGAVGATGLKECDITLDLALRLKALLPCDVLLTRTDNQFVALGARAEMANKWDADFFVSLHCNAAVNSEANGYEIWTSPGQTASDPIATVVFNSLKTSFPREHGRSDMQDGDPDREENFQVLRETACPAILVEMGFISYPATESQMRMPEWRDAMAQAIANGIIEGLGL